VPREQIFDAAQPNNRMRESSSASSPPLPGALPPPPEALWHAVVQGNTEIVEAMIAQGALVSGRTCDPQGHSVFWDAVAFQKAEVALLLLRHFPPGDREAGSTAAAQAQRERGVDLLETHARRGDTLLHLASCFEVFTPKVAELFAAIFEGTSGDHHRSCNAQGQSFLHIAAVKPHVWILRFAAQHNLDALFSATDGAGWSPRILVEHHLAQRGIAEQPPPLPTLAAARVPPWCRLGSVKPSTPGGTRPPFADVALEIQDEVLEKTVQVFAHRVVLAANSEVLHEQLLQLGRGDGGDASPASSSTSSPVVAIPVDSQCCRSADVALFALRFLYTGEPACDFEGNGHLLWQLTCLCAKYRLPAPLLAWAHDALLSCLDDPRYGDVVPVLLRAAEPISLGPEARRFVARRFIGKDAAWSGVEADKRARTLEIALGELEQCLAPAFSQARETQQQHAPQQQAVSSQQLPTAQAMAASMQGGDPRQQDPRLRDPRMQDARMQDPRMQDPRMQDPRLQDPRMQDPRLQDPRMQDPRFQDPRMQDPRMQDPRMQDPRMQDPRVQDPRMQDPRMQDSRMQDPRMQDPRMQDPRMLDPRMQDPRMHEAWSSAGEMSHAERVAIQAGGGAGRGDSYHLMEGYR